MSKCKSWKGKADRGLCIHMCAQAYIQLRIPPSLLSLSIHNKDDKNPSPSRLVPSLKNHCLTLWLCFCIPGRNIQARKGITTFLFTLPFTLWGGGVGTGAVENMSFPEGWNSWNVFFEKQWGFFPLELYHLHSLTLKITSVGTSNHLADPQIMYLVFSILFEPLLPLRRNLVAFLSTLVRSDTYLTSD